MVEAPKGDQFRNQERLQSTAAVDCLDRQSRDAVSRSGQAHWPEHAGAQCRVEYGKLAGVVALVAVVSQYSTLGSGLLFLRYVSPDRSHFRAYWGNILMSVGISGGLLVLGLRLAGSWLTGIQSISLLLPIAISDCLFLQFGSCAGQVFQT